MSNLTTIGKKRFEILRPKWIRGFFPEELGVQDSNELHKEVKKVLKEQMTNQKKVCTYFGFILETDEVNGEVEGYHSIPMVEDYSCEKLVEKFDKETSQSKLTAVRIVFEPHYNSEDLTWFIIVSNN